jgi:predicted type IV restriction endonuclease
MANVPKKVLERLGDGLKRFQPILSAAKARDAGESDTVTIITDMLNVLFGYDKYSEVTSEHAIRGTFCDLAIKVQDQLLLLIECKSIGLDLKEAHLKQAIDYATNKGVDWAVLTNGHIWRVYKVKFTKPIDQELVAQFDLLTINPKDSEQLEALFILCKEGWQKDAISDFYGQSQMLSRFSLGAAILSEPVLESIRRELRKAYEDAPLFQIEDIHRIISAEVLKREVLEGPQAQDAIKKLAKLSRERKKQEPPAGSTQ